MMRARLALLGWLSLLGLVADAGTRAADAIATDGNGPPSVPSAAGTQPRGGTSTLQAARDLIGRVLPDRAEAVTLELIPADGGRDVFEIEGQGGRVTLRGNNGVALASALNWYLKYSCGCHVSLKARQLRVPSPLPSVQPKIRRVSQDRWRYFLNYCCFGYSLPWYDWTQWEQLIDWMALNGVNAPLSVTGQEAVRLAAGRRLGFTESDLQAFLAGPPYLPFGWMGCLDGWGGPLPATWPERHAELQERILARERALGMTPVQWDALLLDPLDPLFGRFATVFLEEQQRRFGLRRRLCGHRGRRAFRRLRSEDRELQQARDSHRIEEGRDSVFHKGAEWTRRQGPARLFIV